MAFCLVHVQRRNNAAENWVLNTSSMNRVFKWRLLSYTRQGFQRIFVLNRVRISNPRRTPIPKHGSSNPPSPAHPGRWTSKERQSQRFVTVLVFQVHHKDTSPSVRFVRFPDLQIFVDMFCTNLQRPVWSRHVGVPPRDINMAAGEQCKHLELTSAIQATDYLN